MGVFQTYLCPKCHYKAADLNGGYGCGFECGRHTISCQQCGRLYDVTVTKKPWDIPRDPKTNEPDYSKFDPYHCPKSKKHTVTLWFEGGACPKCGHEMEVDPEGGLGCWD
jgi:hypothetical protein